MTGSVLRLALLALLLSVALGALVGGMSQMTAVNVEDPRPSVPLPETPSPSPSPSLAPTPTATPVPPSSPAPEGADVWLYTIAEGDSISGLAIRFGSTTEELLALNPEYADNQDLVQAGAQMILPCTPIAVAEARC